MFVQVQYKDLNTLWIPVITALWRNFAGKLIGDFCPEHELNFVVLSLTSDG